MNYDSMPSLGNRHSQHSFATTPDIKMARSKFDRSFASKDTMDFDQLTPVMVDEVLPGDTINLNLKTFARLAPQVTPVMDNMYIDYFSFFVPTRLLWNNWERFNGAQTDPGDSTDYLIPTITSAAGLAVGSIYDHLGLPTEISNTEFSALPLRAYNLIYNEWFRDENLQDSLTINLGDGPDAEGDYALVNRAKKHDYFTSCLPWPQKGDAVTLPLGTSAPVISSGDPVQMNSLNDVNPRNVSYDTVNTEMFLENFTGNNADYLFAANGGTGTGYLADLTNATAATINQLRQSFMVQSLLELDARGGTRYVEIIRAHFNVVSPDFRLQRPEFLSGGSTTINQHPVAQTSESNTTPLGQLAAFSTASTMNNNIGFSKSFTEHGYVIVLAQARADITYQQGMNKMWSRSTRFDFFWPKLQELGEQAVLNKEIYFDGTIADDGVFGYQERYAEYRYKPSEIKGQFRSTFATSLDVWHLAEEFGSAPSLNSTFIQSNTPIDRVLTVGASYPHLIMDMWFDYKHARPIMTYGVPATLGRF